MAFKSDHPVLNSQHLVFEAQKAHHYGFNESLAIKAITSVPAKALGIEYRVGYLREGFDADVVLWDRNPLEIGAHPLKVWVDGHETFTHPLFHSKQPPHHDNHPSGAPLKSKKKETSVKTAATTTTSTFAAKSEEMRIESSRVSNSYFIENLSTIYADRNVTLSADPAGDETLSLVVVVEEGLVKCMGTAKACNVTSSLHPDMKTMDAQGGVMIPGMIAAHGRLGLEEIESERVTKDGYAHFDPATGGTRAVDGLRVWKSGSKELTAAYNSGCLFGVSLPRASGFVQGQSCVFRTGAEGEYMNLKILQMERKY